MFDFFRRHTRVLQFVLVLLVFPSFVFFGIQGYSRFNGGDAESIAKVAGTPITRAQLEASLRERVEQARRQMPTLDPKLFETPEMRGLALDALVRDRVLIVAADKLHLATTDERLDRLFKADPQFLPLRNPDGSLNKDVVASLGYSSEGFAARLREDYSRKQVLQGVANSALAPSASASAALDALYQQREVQVQRFDAKDYLAKAAPTEAQIEAFYKDPANAARFMAPAEASIEYVVLDLESLKKGVSVPEDDVRKYYSENEKRYTTPEERKVSQILVAADKGAPKADRDKARVKAESLLAEVKKDPTQFAEIAKKNSDDDSTAAKGGQMEFFGRGTLLDLKPFEDAAFALKAGETSGIVETNFGFHIVRLDAVRGGDKKSFDSVRPQIEAEQRNLLAQKRFSEAAVEFGDTVYEQSDTLKPAADKWKLDIRKAEHVTRAPAAGASGPLANPKFLESVFASEALRDKRNTKAVDIGANQLASARVVQSVPARPRPLAEVKEQIRAELSATQATAMARKAGGEKLAAAKSAPATALSDTTQIVSRAQPRELPRPLLDAVLKANAQTLPVLVGVDLGADGYAIAKITKLWGRDPSAAAAEANVQYARIWGDAESQAYYAALKSRFDVSIGSKATVATTADDAASASTR